MCVTEDVANQDQVSCSRLECTLASCDDEDAGADGIAKFSTEDESSCAAGAQLSLEGNSFGPALSQS